MAKLRYQFIQNSCRHHIRIHIEAFEVTLYLG